MTQRLIARAVVSTGTATEPYRADARAGRHTFVSDESAGGGGADAGPAPFALVMSGLASCTAITLRMYADRKGFDLEVSVDARYEMDEEGNTSVSRTIHVPVELSLERRERLADIAERTPVTLALKAGMAINTTFT